MTPSNDKHNDLIVDQFTRQAVPFAEMAAHSDDEAMRRLIAAAAIGKDGTLLDVACGPGIVVSAFAPHVKHATGIDITPAMIEQAKHLQQQRMLTNVSWKLGDVSALPFADDSFDAVVSRYAFHHLIDPGKVLHEMARVCRPGGRVVLADVFVTSAAQGEAYDHLEKLRDPSHTRAVPLDELTGMFKRLGLAMETRPEFYRVDVELDTLLTATRTPPEPADEVRKLVSADVGQDKIGMAARREKDKLHISFPVVILAGKKSHSRG